MYFSFYHKSCSHQRVIYYLLLYCTVLFFTNKFQNNIILKIIYNSCLRPKQTADPCVTICRQENYFFYGRVFFPRHGAHKARKVRWITRDGANNRHTDRQTDRRTDRQTDRQTEIIFFDQSNIHKK